MKFQFLAPVAASAIIALSSCSKDEGPSGPGVNFGDPAEITVHLVNADAPASRAISGKQPGEGDENKIAWLEFYVFDGTGDNLDPNTGTGKGYVKINSSQLTHRIRVSQGADKKFIVVANSNIGEPAEGTKYAQILAKITSNEFAADPDGDRNPRIIFENGFEMSGTASKTINEGVNNQVYVTLTRTVSRINPPAISSSIPVRIPTQELLNEIWDPALGVDLDTDIEFSFDSYAVVNGAPQSNVSFVGNDAYNYKDPVNAPWDKWVSKGNINSSFDAQKQYTRNYSGPSDVITDSWLLAPTEGPVYVYETKPEPMDTPGVSGYNPKSVYAYIIEGTLTPDKAGADPVKRYWRVDLTTTDYYHIMRNCVYKVSINKISTPGYGTPQEAEDEDRPVPEPGESSADFYVSIEQWDINEYETDM